MGKILAFLFLSFTSLLLNAQPTTIGLFYNTEDAWNGYTLMGPMFSDNVYLIDNCGELVHEWNLDSPPGLMVYLNESGELIRTEFISSGFPAGGSGGRISKYSWEGDLLWRYDYSTSKFHQHHDIELMPNGNILVLAWESFTNAEAIAAGRMENNVGAELWAEKVAEIRPIGTDSIEEVWTWHLWDHLIQDIDDSKENFGVVSEHPEKMDINNSGTNSLPFPGQTDWVHFNSIDYNAELDQIILSSRHLNEIVIIDHSTSTAEAATGLGGNAGKGGDLLYRWGNPSGYDRGTVDDRQLYGQHNAEWVKLGDEQKWGISLYNNGIGRPGPDFSEVFLLDLPLENGFSYALESNSTYRPESPSLIFDSFEGESFISTNVSGVQLLPNGNLLTTVGQKGRLLEVDTATLTEQWKYINPINNNGPASQGTNPPGNNLFRVNRYAENFIGFDGRDLQPMGPLELNPLPSDCQLMTSTLSPKTDETSFSVFPNPTEGTIRIIDDGLTNYTIYDSFGHLIRSINKTERTIVLEEFNSGVYFICPTEGMCQRIVLLR